MDMACREDDRDAVQVMRALVKSYFKVVTGTMKDQVPKVIMRFVVKQTEGSIQNHLISHLLRRAAAAADDLISLVRHLRGCQSIPCLGKSLLLQ